MPPQPLVFQPIYREKVWGGRVLEERLGKILPAGVSVGESWELADLPDSIPGGRSIIANGPFKGRTLREAIAAERSMIMGSSRLSKEGGFPLLIKYLDARQNLSVQVHPDAAYAAAHPEAHLKSEAWVIVDAEPGAVIYKGVKPEVDRAMFERHIRDNIAVDDLIAVPVKAGDVHYLPSGTCHALGAGIVVAEVQTPSDTTFRVYDWGRPTGAGRELHIEQAMACISFGITSATEAEPIWIEADGLRTALLVKTEFFAIERIDAEAGRSLGVVTDNQPVIWMILRGGGFIATPGVDDVGFSGGTTMLMPAKLESATARFIQPTSFLRITLPSRLEGMLA